MFMLVFAVHFYVILTVNTRIQKVCQRGFNFDNVFFLFLFSLVDEEREDPNTTIKGPLSARQ